MRPASALLGPHDTPRLRSLILPADPDRVDVRVLPAWVPVPGWVGAITTPWAIYIRPHLLGGDPAILARLLVHELIHVRQWKTLGVPRFLASYLSDYLRGRLRGLGHRDAYQSIRLEREAGDGDRPTG